MRQSKSTTRAVYIDNSLHIKAPYQLKYDGKETPVSFFFFFKPKKKLNKEKRKKRGPGPQHLGAKQVVQPQILHCMTMKTWKINEQANTA